MGGLSSWMGCKRVSYVLVNPPKYHRSPKPQLCFKYLDDGLKRQKPKVTLRHCEIFAIFQDLQRKTKNIVQGAYTNNLSLPHVQGLEASFKCFEPQVIWVKQNIGCFLRTVSEFPNSNFLKLSSFIIGLNQDFTLIKIDLKVLSCKYLLQNIYF